jgi:2,4-dichlorophenol 6-monooxygenase
MTKDLLNIKSFDRRRARKADYDLASPTRICDLPQNYLEPILLEAAGQRDTVIRFNTRSAQPALDFLDMSQPYTLVVDWAATRVRSKEPIARAGSHEASLRIRVVDQSQQSGLPAQI